MIREILRPMTVEEILIAYRMETMTLKEATVLLELKKKS